MAVSVAELLEEIERDGLPLQAVGRLARKHHSVVFRWVVRGIPRAAGGPRIRLEAVRLGRPWWTSRAALARFFAAVTPEFDDDFGPTPRTATARQRASERAAKRLSQIGI
jgi:hypothetical protein